MTNLEYFVDKLTTFFANAIEANPTRIPPQILAIKEVVEDFFGVENVELRLTQSFYDHRWNDLLSNISFYTLCDQCGVSTVESIWDNKNLDDTAHRILYPENNEFFNKFISYVDIQKMLLSSILPLFTLLIKFENITITNEDDQSTVINEMFVRFSISPTGVIIDNPYWIRTVYTYEHFNSHYSHSHLPYSSLSVDSGSRWQHPCLGSGPITMTIHNLQEEFNIDIWPLLCRELDVCIRTESLAGGPYSFIREITPLTTKSTDIFTFGVVADDCPFSEHIRNEIFTRVLKGGKLKWVYRAGYYELANDFCELNALFTQAYLDYYMETIPVNSNTADELLSQGILYLGYFTPQDSIRKVIIKNHIFEGKTFPTSFYFKGVPISCRVLSYNPFRDVDHSKTMLLLELKIVSLLHKLLILLANSVWK